MITATYHPSGLTHAAAVTVALDASGRVTVTRHAAPDCGAPTVSFEVAHHGVLPPDALARIRERVRTLHATSSARRGPATEVGLGNAAAVLHTSLTAPPGPPPLVVHFQATPASVHALDTSAWRVPRAGDLAAAVARVGAALVAGTLASVDTGLPATIEREGVLLRFHLDGEPPNRPTVVAYESGRCEAWEDVDGWTGRRVAHGQTDESTVSAAHTAVLALLRAVVASEGPAPEVGAAHDPTHSLRVSVLRDGQLVEWSTVWGRASRNDAPLEPVPDSVPMALFDAAVLQLRALRDGLAQARRAAPAPSGAAASGARDSEFDALLVEIPVEPAPTPDPPPESDPRIPWLAELRTLLERGTPHTVVLRAAERAPAGVTVYGCLNGDDVQLSFRPPVQLAAFVTAMGITAPLVVSNDEDGVYYHLVTASEGRQVHPYSAPPMGPYTVSATTSSFYEGRAVARWLGWPVFDASSLPSATVYGVTVVDTRLRRS